MDEDDVHESNTFNVVLYGAEGSTLGGVYTSA